LSTPHLSGIRTHNKFSSDRQWLHW
jgi:hypothetical protein